MKKFLLLVLICFAQNTFSQHKEVKKSPDNLRDNLKNYKEEEIILDENHIYNTAGLEIKPDFFGGQQTLDKFIKENYKTPTDKTLKGNIYVTFIVEKDGSLSDIKVLRDLGLGTGAEAIRILKLSPKWKPGKQNDKEIRALYSLVVRVHQ